MSEKQAPGFAANPGVQVDDRLPLVAEVALSEVGGDKAYCTYDMDLDSWKIYAVKDSVFSAFYVPKPEEMTSDDCELREIGESIGRRMKVNIAAFSKGAA